MKIRMRKIELLCGLGAAAIVLAYSPGRANAQVKQNYVLGDVLVYCQPGLAQPAVQALAASVGAVNVIPNNMKDVYEFILPVAQATVVGTSSAIATLKPSANVRWVGNNAIATPFTTSVIPNDPYYSQMWPMPLINMPQAWALQKGSASIELADIDTGFDPMHADLQGRYDLPNSYNWGDGSTNIEAISDDHGVSTSGIMIANTNNSIGVSAICWQNVLCVGEKVQQESIAGIPTSALLAACADIILKYKKAHIVAVNISLGATYPTPMLPTDPEYVAMQSMANLGILVVAAAGNSSGDDHLIYPAALPFVTTVSAVNRNSQLTYYSSFGKVDISAPGGEQFSDTDPNGYLVCKLGSGYAFEQGTSFACPTVVGVLSLMMSVPGVTSTKALSVVLSTANKTGLTTLPDPRFGNGIVDAYNALVQVSSSTSILAPNGIDLSTGTALGGGSTAPPPVTTQKPLMAFNAYNIPTDSETFTIDPGPSQISFTATQLIQNVTPTSTLGTSYGATSTIANVSDVTLTGTTAGTNPQYTISFRYTFPATNAGTHVVQVTGINPANSQVITDAVRFTVAPHVFPTDSSGVALISIPYYSDSEDQASAQQAQLPSPFPSTLNLYRWLNVPTLVPGTSNTVVAGMYAIYGPSHTSADPGASTAMAALSPGQFVPTVDPSSQGSLSPIGTAYFMQTPAPLTYATYGIDYPYTSFSIPLHQGWNMIGDPYLFSVDFNGMEIQQLSGSRITMQAAADANFLLPHIYQYANGDYTFQSLPDGTLDPWQGQWIYVLPTSGSTTLSTGVAGYLIVSPAAVAGSSRAARVLTPAIQHAITNQPAVTGPGSWSMQLQALTGTLHDNTNYVGESSRATLGMDATKVPKPPKAGQYVTLGLSHSGLGITGLAQDLLPIGGTRQWQVTVTTNQSKAPITIAWPNVSTVPKNYRLVLTDTVTNQNVDMRNQSSYEFTSAAADSTRSFTLTATPSNNRARVVVSNITVDNGRAGGRAAGTSQIGFSVSADSQVDVSVLGSNGRMIALVSPGRAVTAGLNTVVWTGQDLNGHTVPGGTYILQIRAIDSGGNLTRQIVPFTVSGR